MGGGAEELAGAALGRRCPEAAARAPKPPAHRHHLPPATADWRGPQHQQHLPARGGRRDSGSHCLRDPQLPPGETSDFSPRAAASPPVTVATPSSWPLPNKVEAPGSRDSRVRAGPDGVGEAGARPRRVPPHRPGPRSSAVAAPQPPRRLVSCTAGRVGLRPRWAGRAWGAPAPRGAPCSAPRAGAASPPPSRRWPATFPA